MSRRLLKDKELFLFDLDGVDRYASGHRVLATLDNVDAIVPLL